MAGKALTPPNPFVAKGGCTWRDKTRNEHHENIRGI
jgi:hypothetical protein